MDSRSIDQIAAELRTLEPKTVRHRAKDYPDPAKQEDHDYRRAYGTDGKRPFGRGLRAGFYAYLPDAPIGRYVTREDAQRYAAKIREVQEMQVWPAYERERLHVLFKRWDRRARGLDARFNALGVQGGFPEKYRPKSVGDTLLAIRSLCADSGGLREGPGPKFVTDPKWPMGRPT